MLIPAKASSPFLVCLVNAIITPETPTVAEVASPVVLVYVEINAPSSSNEIPKAAAKPASFPSTWASSDDSNIPVFTIAPNVSNASAADNTSFPYAFCAAPAIFAKSVCEPNPIATPFETCSKVSIAFAPFNPADVKKNKPSANSFGACAVVPDNSKIESLN